MPAADKIKVPLPALVILSPDPAIAPPTVKVSAVTVTVGLAPKVTDPVPRFKLEEPLKVKLPFQVWALLFASVMAAPEVLSIVVALSIVKVPVPKAPALLISKVPAAKVRPPLKLLLPDRTNVPAPCLMIAWAPPPIVPPSVKVSAVTVTVADAFKVTAPVPRFKLEEPVKVKLPAQICALLLMDVVIAAPEVLSIVVEALIVKVPVPKAPALLISSVPTLNVIPPLKLLLPVNTKVPAPDLVILLPPEMAPPTVKVLAVTVTVGLALKVTAPVPRFKDELPVNV